MPVGLVRAGGPDARAACRSIGLLRLTSRLAACWIGQAAALELHIFLSRSSCARCDALTNQNFQTGCAWPRSSNWRPSACHATSYPLRQQHFVKQRYPFNLSGHTISLPIENRGVEKALHKPWSAVCHHTASGANTSPGIRACIFRCHVKAASTFAVYYATWLRYVAPGCAQSTVGYSYNGRHSQRPRGRDQIPPRSL